MTFGNAMPNVRMQMQSFMMNTTFFFGGISLKGVPRYLSWGNGTSVGPRIYATEARDRLHRADG